MNSRDDLDAGRLMNLARSKKACQILAEKLEIQTDGGDSPADFVAYALEQASNEYVRADAQKTLDNLDAVS